MPLPPPGLCGSPSSPPSAHPGQPPFSPCRPKEALPSHPCGGERGRRPLDVAGLMALRGPGRSEPGEKPGLTCLALHPAPPGSDPPYAPVHSPAAALPGRALGRHVHGCLPGLPLHPHPHGAAPHAGAHPHLHRARDEMRKAPAPLPTPPAPTSVLPRGRTQHQLPTLPHHSWTLTRQSRCLMSGRAWTSTTRCPCLCSCYLDGQPRDRWTEGTGAGGARPVLLPPHFYLSE